MCPKERDHLKSEMDAREREIGALKDAYDREVGELKDHGNMVTRKYHELADELGRMVRRLRSSQEEVAELKDAGARTEQAIAIFRNCAWTRHPPRGGGGGGGRKG